MRYLWLIFLLHVYAANAQKILGQWKGMGHHKLRLEGFNGFKSYAIDSCTVDNAGGFSLSYNPDDYGMGCLISEDNTRLFVVLCNENIEMYSSSSRSLESLKVIKGNQNMAFAQYAATQPRREQALSAWEYLRKLYRSDSSLSTQLSPRQLINDEVQRLKKEDIVFIGMLPQDSYTRWLLPLQKLLMNVSVIAQYRVEEVPATLKELRNINYADQRLYKSGLYKDAIENHVWFIENTSGATDSVFSDLNISIDKMLQPLTKDPSRYNEFVGYLFDLLESRSLFGSSEYLALKVFGDNSCSIDTKLANKLESYRKFKKGNKAPDISFERNTLFPQGFKASNLLALPDRFKLVVFAASWCEHCRQVLPQIASMYSKWKTNGVEVVMVSLDETEKDFVGFASSFPFVSVCDFKKWNGKAVIDYHISATPTYYLLNRNLEIMLKPVSVEQIEAWITYSAD